MNRMTAEEQVEQIARTVACEAEAALLWKLRDWEWYHALRSAILSMIRRNECLEIRHLLFVWFVQKYFILGEGESDSEEDLFLEGVPSAGLQQLAASVPLWSVDECELFPKLGMRF